MEINRRRALWNRGRKRRKSIGDELRGTNPIVFHHKYLVFSLSGNGGSLQAAAEVYTSTFTLKGYLGAACGQSIAGTVAQSRGEMINGSDQFADGWEVRSWLSVSILEIEHKDISR